MLTCTRNCAFLLSCEGETRAKKTPKKMNTEKKCWSYADLADDIEALEVSAGERDGFPRFMVYLNENKALEVKTKRSLNKLLESIYWTAPRIFRNAGKGVTIDFS